LVSTLQGVFRFSRHPKGWTPNKPVHEKRSQQQGLAMNRKPRSLVAPADLRGRAEARLRKQHHRQKSAAGEPASKADPRRLLQELQVHQVELEMQNAELQEARDGVEALLEKYTDLYDFAPVGYFSLDDQGRILEVNLTGAALLGVERSRLINQRLLRFVAATTQPAFRAFLERVFAKPGKQVCEVTLRNEDGTTFWANLHAASAISLSDPRKWCRVAVSDITALKQAEEAQHRLEALATTNRELNREIARRQTVEDSLKNSEQEQKRLLEQSRHMQEQLRHLSRQVLLAQEEERKRISRELHDVIAQTLTGINVRLETLAREASLNPSGLKTKIVRAQRLVEKSVDIVHRFARELRPTVLDDLGLVPALLAFMKSFTKETGIRVSLTSFTSGQIEQLDSARRTVLYRVAQEALTNVARHAHASRVEARLQKLPKAVLLSIKDDGQSFQVESGLHAGKSKRLGLLGMRERVEMVGGQFTVISSPGHGTTVQAQIPLMTDH
jgi:PAS domain S-box-containing protein